jgi:hypothetical protein
MFEGLKPENRECAPLRDLLSASSWKGCGGSSGGIHLKSRCGCKCSAVETCSYVTTGTEINNFQHKIKILQKA